MTATGEFFENLPDVTTLLQQAAEALAHPAVEQVVDAPALFPGSTTYHGIELPHGLRTIY